MQCGICFIHFSLFLSLQEYIVGFNFASTDEARDLKNIVEQKIQARKRREARRSRNLQNKSQQAQVTQDFVPVKKIKDPGNAHNLYVCPV